MKNKQNNRLHSWSLSWQLASRYYATGVQNSYVRFINRASRVGFALGVAALIIGLSVMNGFERELKNTLLSVIPDVEFKSVSGVLSNWPKTSKEIQRNGHVTGVAPYIDLNAMVQKQNSMEAVLLKGVNADLEPSVNAIPSSIKSGLWLSSAESIGHQEAVVGHGLAKKLNIKLGDSLELLVPKISEGNRLSAPEYLNFNVVGIYQVGGQMDYGQVFVKLSDLQKNQGLTPLQAQGIKVSLDDPFNANRLGMMIGNSISDYVYVLDWFRSQGHVYNDIVMVKDIMYLVMVLVMAVASFNIISSLSMSVQEKYSDIGILKTLGLSQRSVKHVFVLMGLLTALRGIFWGLLIGVLVAYYLPAIFQALETLSGMTVLDADVYFVDHLPSEVDSLQVLVIAVTALCIAFLASLYPASKASKLRPVELLS